MEAQRRDYYRVWYPDNHRPSLYFGEARFDVAELSEGGARVLVDPEDEDLPEFPQGERFRARMCFVDGDEVEIAARYLRKDGDQVILRLILGVSLKRMIDEQLRLRRIFGTA